MGSMFFAGLGSSPGEDTCIFTSRKKKFFSLRTTRKVTPVRVLLMLTLVLLMLKNKKNTYSQFPSNDPLA